MQSRLKSYFSLRDIQGLCRWKVELWLNTFWKHFQEQLLYLHLKFHSKTLIISFGCDHKFICLSKILPFWRSYSYIQSVPICFLIMSYLSNFHNSIRQNFKMIFWYQRISNSEDIWQPGSMVLDNELFVQFSTTEFVNFSTTVFVKFSKI